MTVWDSAASTLGLRVERQGSDTGLWGRVGSHDLVVRHAEVASVAPRRSSLGRAVLDVVDTLFAPRPENVVFDDRPLPETSIVVTVRVNPAFDVALDEPEVAFDWGEALPMNERATLLFRAALELPGGAVQLLFRRIYVSNVELALVAKDDAVNEPHLVELVSASAAFADALDRARATMPVRPEVVELVPAFTSLALEAGVPLLTCPLGIAASIDERWIVAVVHSNGQLHVEASHRVASDACGRIESKVHAALDAFGQHEVKVTESVVAATGPSPTDPRAVVDALVRAIQSLEKGQQQAFR